MHYLCITLFSCTSSYASYIKALYCIVLHTSIYRELLIILTWYQSHCSKCFVQSSSFLAFFRCLNHLRYCFATAVRIPVCPLPSKVEYIAKKLIAFIGIFSTDLRSEHLYHHSKDLTPLDSTVQKSPPFDTGRAAWRTGTLSRHFTRLHVLGIFSDTSRPLVCHVSRWPIVDFWRWLFDRWLFCVDFFDRELTLTVDFWHWLFDRVDFFCNPGVSYLVFLS